jgi:GNAT superfamily N-acetyltransferase
MADLVWREARAIDAAQIHALIERAYRDPASAERWDSESHLLTGPRTSIEEVAGLIADADSRFVLAEAAGRLAACALIQRTCHPPLAMNGSGEAAYFGMFAVDPSRRALGLGAQHLTECERRVRELWRPAGLALTVISLREELMAWYGRRGYARTGRRHAFPFSEATGETRRDFDLVEFVKVLA